MLNPKQKRWVNHLSDTDKIKIIPYDPTSEEKFQMVKERVQKALGKKYHIEHRGASGMGISGQDEIDTYIPVSVEEFDSLIPKLKELFGEPGSHYPLDRVRFKTFIDGKRIDIYLINKEASSWLDGVKFENYIKSHPESLDEYRKLKEDGNGLSIREYYRRKIIFMNEILEIAK